MSTQVERAHGLEALGIVRSGRVHWNLSPAALYEEALASLRVRDLVYDCACSRADLLRAASAPLGAELAYPGTCRNGLPPGRPARAIRFRVPEGAVSGGWKPADG